MSYNNPYDRIIANFLQSVGEKVLFNKPIDTKKELSKLEVDTLSEILKQYAVNEQEMRFIETTAEAAKQQIDHQGGRNNGY